MIHQYFFKVFYYKLFLYRIIKFKKGGDCCGRKG
nr:MAG TPA: hypothetical protein [Caudoviricetes sp.]